MFQVTVPIGQHDRCPVSVSFIARHGGDRFLLDTVNSMYASLQEQATAITSSKPSSNIVSQEESAEMAKEKVGYPFVSADAYLSFCEPVLLHNDFYCLLYCIPIVC